MWPQSARRKTGVNLAVLDPATLASPPRPHSSWAFLATDDDLIATPEMSEKAMRFTGEGFGLN